MTQDEIIRMAREAGFGSLDDRLFLFGKNDVVSIDYLERFAALVAAHERTKDLTDDEIYEAFYSCGFGATIAAGGRAVIAAYKEKNK